MTTEYSSQVLQRRKVRDSLQTRAKLDEIVELMDRSGVTVQDIQQHLERVQDENSTFDRVLSKRQWRRSQERKRKALRLAAQRRKAKAQQKRAQRKKTNQASGKRADQAKGVTKSDKDSEASSGQSETGKEDGEVSQ